MKFRFIVALLVAVSLSGCVVLKSTHEEALAKIQNLEVERDRLLNKAHELEKTLADKEKELVAKVNETTRLKAEVDEIRIAKDKEIADIKLKIKEVQIRAEALVEKIKSIQM